jgi:hypothetical protein
VFARGLGPVLVGLLQAEEYVIEGGGQLDASVEGTAGSRPPGAPSLAQPAITWRQANPRITVREVPTDGMRAALSFSVARAGGRRVVELIRSIRSPPSSGEIRMEAPFRVTSISASTSLRAAPWSPLRSPGRSN